MEKKPNILIITTDQQRFDAIGAVDPRIYTPNLNQLAKEGALYTHTYTPNPVCVPARQNILTGLTARHHGFDDNDFARHRYSPYYLPKLPQILSDAGYDTIAIGKLHFEPNRRHDGFHRYFMIDEVPRHREEDDYALYLKNNGYDHISALHGVRDPLYMMPQHSVVDKKDHSSTWIADLTIEQLKINSGKRPFFFWSGFVHPHPPMDVIDEFADLYKDKDLPEPIQSISPVSWLAEENKNIVSYPNEDVFRRFRELYYASIAQVDEQIGKILQALKDLNLYDQTCIIFCSDHGEMLGDMDTFQKFLPYDGSSRVPFIIRYPEKIKPDTTVNALINLNDIMPTLLEIAGAQYPAPFELAGQSVFDLNNRNETFIEHGKEARRWVSVVTPDYKYAYYYGGAREELFDLVNDPKERINLLDDHQSSFDDIRKQLRSKCIDWELCFGLEDHIENHDFKQWPQPQLRPFMGTGELIFPKRIMDPHERAKIQPLREQIVNVVKDEPVLRLKDLDFSYMLQTRQLTEEDIAWIIEQDNINKEGK